MRSDPRTNRFSFRSTLDLVAVVYRAPLLFSFVRCDRGLDCCECAVRCSGAGVQDRMIYDVNSALFRSFLSQKGAGDKRRAEEPKPNQQRAPKANENKPVMNE